MTETPRVRLVTMTPEWAKRLLKNNDGNRKWRPSHSRFIADEISNGRGELTTDAVGIRTNGHIGNGRHRLEAIVASGVAMEVILLEGITDAAFKVIDTGVKRNVRDALHITATLAAEATLIAQLTVEGKQVGMRVSPTHVEAVLAWWGPIHQRLYDTATESPKGLASCGIRVGVGLRFAQQTDAALGEYVLQQYFALLKADTGRMANAVRSLWNRYYRKSIINRRRDVVAALTWRCFDPSTRSAAPHFKDPEAMIEEVRAGLCALRDQIVPNRTAAVNPFMPTRASKGSRPKKADRVPAQVSAHV